MGKITLGDFEEEFVSSLYTWSKNDYESQWRLALNHLLLGDGKAALITEYISPEVSDRLLWWPTYREEQSVYFQEQILFFDNAPAPLTRLAEPFRIDRQFTYVHDRRTINEDGERISEWSVSLADIEAFTATLK
jgi:hypothetical protein